LSKGTYSDVCDFLSRLGDCGVVLAGVKAKPCGWPAASLDPAPGDANKTIAGSREGNGEGGSWRGVSWAVGAVFDVVFLILLGKLLVIEHRF
jgi:hypothetical protein